MQSLTRRRRRFGGLLVALAVVVLGGVLVWRFWPGGAGAGNTPNTTQITARFVTTPTAAAEADAPLRVEVTVILAATGQKGPRVLPLVDLQLRDAAGQSARYGPTAGVRAPMNVTAAVSGWRADLSAPSVPGRYHAHVFVSVPGTAEQEFDLTSPTLDVVPAVAYTGGLVYTLNGNLWRIDPAGQHPRRLTFYSDNGRADYPAWAPGGRRIAFARTLAAAANQIPNSEIWTVAPDGGSAQALVARRSDEDLTMPAFAPEGTIYFTSDRTFDPATGGTPTMDALTKAQESWHLERQPGGATGARQAVLTTAQMANLSHDGRLLAYLDAPTALAESYIPPTHTLMLAAADGGNPRVIVPADAFSNVLAPQLAPDGTRIAFAAVNPSGVPDGTTLLRLLGLEPLPARANGVPWDIYLVAATGGPVTRVTQRNADQPWPAWSPDGKTLAFLDDRGLYLLDLSKAGTEPQKIGPGSSHGQLAWYAP